MNGPKRTAFVRTKLDDLNARRLRAFVMADRAFLRGDTETRKKWESKINEIETQMEELQ